MDKMEDYPGENAGRKVERTSEEAFGNSYGRITRAGIYILGGLGEMRSQVGYEVQAYGQGYKPDDKGLDHITLGDRQNHREHIEHTGQRSQRQELVARKDNCEQKGHGDKQERYHEGGRMADYQSRAHTDADAGRILEFPRHHILSGLGNGFQALDKEAGNAGNEFHHRTHLDTKSENGRDILYPFIPGRITQYADDKTYYDAKEQRLAQDAEFLLHPFGINIQLAHSGNLVEAPVETLGKGDEALAEWLRDGNTIEVLVILLELPCGQVGHEESDNEADDGGEEAPPYTSAGEIDHSADEGIMPVIPKVDVDGLCRLDKQEQDVDSQTDRDDKCTYRSIIGH